jgi:hypothetical protein
MELLPEDAGSMVTYVILETPDLASEGRVCAEPGHMKELQRDGKW